MTNKNHILFSVSLNCGIMFSLWGLILMDLIWTFSCSVTEKKQDHLLPLCLVTFIWLIHSGQHHLQTSSEGWIEEAEREHGDMKLPGHAAMVTPGNHFFLFLFFEKEQISFLHFLFSWAIYFPTACVGILCSRHN